MRANRFRPQVRLVGEDGDQPRKPLRLSSGMWWILLSFTTINLVALPLWLVYLSQVMWPTAILEVIGAIQIISIVAALIAWRTTDGFLGRRAIIGVLLILGGSVALLGVGRVAESAGERTTVLIVTVVMTFGMMYARLALLEMAHRLVLEQDKVMRVFTLLDVVDSSFLQLGLFGGGMLAPGGVVGGSLVEPPGGSPARSHSTSRPRSLAA